jgi:hypothetical protein
MTPYKPKRILFLIHALSLSVTTFGQTSKDCSKTLPCEVLDIAQAKIEKGAICEQQRKQDSTIIKNQADIIVKYERTIVELQVESNRKDTKITTLEDKVKKRGQQRFTWAGAAALGTKILDWIF